VRQPSKLPLFMFMRGSSGATIHRIAAVDITTP
jgi:hypothetical protein